MKKYLLMLSTIVLIACRDKQSSHGLNDPQEKKKEVTSNDKKKIADADIMKFITHELIDQQGTGMVASTYLLPEGWTPNDKLYWEYNDATVPIRYKGVFKNEDGSMLIQSYPDVRSSWNTGPSGTWGYRAPSDIISGMKDLITQERPGRKIRYVNQKILSNHKQNGAQLSSQYTSVSQGGVITIGYDEGGQSFEEEFYGQLDVTRMTTPSVMGNMESVIWSGNSLYSVKAVKGKLDKCRKIAQTIKSSARDHQTFFQ